MADRNLDKERKTGLYPIWGFLVMVAGVILFVLYLSCTVC